MLQSCKMSPLHPLQHALCPMLLSCRYAADVDPPLSAAQQYVVNDMDALGYCHLLAVGSVDGLVEASRQSRVCAGAANQVACTIFRCACAVHTLCARHVSQEDLVLR